MIRHGLASCVVAIHAVGFANDVCRRVTPTIESDAPMRLEIESKNLGISVAHVLGVVRVVINLGSARVAILSR